jgi:hypothetical protein
LYSIKNLAGKYQQTNQPMKNKEGITISNLQEQANRWTQYVKELLNRPAPLPLVAFSFPASYRLDNENNNRRRKKSSSKGFDQTFGRPEFYRRLSISVP